MISQRRVAQLGLLSAAAVFVICMGVLMSHGDGNLTSNSPVQTVDSSSHQNPALPIALSAATDKR
jgi:hypothetical protein